MKFVKGLSLGLALSAQADDSFNVQEVGYCGVPAIKPNEGLFDSLPLRTFHSQKQKETNGNKYSQKTSSQVYSQAPKGIIRTRGRGRREVTSPLPYSANAFEDDEELQRPSPSEVHLQQALQRLNENETTSKYPTALRNNHVPDSFYTQPALAVRIVNGTDSVAYSWPWQIHLSVCGIWNGNNHECNICGGSLIAQKWVVTAAHCVPEDPDGTVMVGAYEVSKGGKEQIPVKRFISHPKWNFGAMFDNDIAVLELAYPAKLGQEVTPICLPQKSVCFTEGTPCVATGWGMLTERGGFPDRLQEVAVKLIGRERCRRYSGYGHITDRMICAGYEAGGRDACAGDSGGPLVCRDGPDQNSPWVLYGIVSWGYGCARPGNPGVYALVPSLIDWVKEQTGLDPTVEMNECYDGAADIQKSNQNKPKPTRKPTTKPVTAKVQDHRPPSRDEVAAESGTYNCMDAEKGRGQFQTDNGIFKSNRYPNSYSNNQLCYYCVTPAKEGAYVKVVLDEVHLDRKKNCHKNGDYMLVEPENKQAYYLCSVKKRDKHVIVNRGSICLKFVTNKSKAKRGFFATYSQVSSPPSGCGGDQIINLDESTKSGEHQIRSKGWPQTKYSDREPSQCSWLIAMTPEMKQKNIKIELDFDQLQLEKKAVHCDESDKITIYGSTSCEPQKLKSAPILYVLCGHYKQHLSPLLKVNAQSICVVFDVNGDSSKNGVGFGMFINLLRP